MLTPTEEDLKQFAAALEREKKFLIHQGWLPDGKDDFISPPAPKFSWIKPQTKYSWRDALDKAVSACIYSNGWFPVIVKTSLPKTKFNKQNDEFCYYSHANYNRLFHFGDLSNCFVHGNNFENTISLVAEHFSKMPTLRDLQYSEDMWIHVNFWIEDSQPYYELVEIGSWREKKKEKDSTDGS